ncbi:Complex I intermediate-associated protein 30 (CIA30) [Aquimonas voraii]|uniref:Complex I intermediate-associated protein 30 (CIA30) n=2 Tax=Aquimonas voraii TaxID=265719 RepID=A0A1G6S048_9GAMM|nr:Complex I intermediate-associated protein 30 (CIA30) [Aquimonas voraii]
MPDDAALRPRRHRSLACNLCTLALLAQALATHAMAQDSPLLLDDFSDASGRASIGTRWQGFSDRVMGGLSHLQAGYVEDAGSRHLRMVGRVRLENNGGFIQVRLPLAANGGDFDASAFRALRVEVRGEPGAYWIHLRSADTRLPWAYYRAPVAVTADWRPLDLPLASFEAVSTTRPLDARRLRSVALVAYGEAFDADVELRRLELLP